MLDKILGGAMQAIPGANVLGLVMKGIELLKGLLESKDLKGAEDVVKLLSELMQKNNEPGGTSPAEAQPFTPPGGPFAMQEGAQIEVEVRISAPRGAAVPREALPLVDGSPQGDQMLNSKASPFIEGSDANKSRALQPNSKEWTAVMWAMQSNPNVHYNADTQRFFAKTSDGGKLDLGSLKDVQNTIEQNGGYNRSNPTAMGFVGKQLSEKLATAQSEPVVSSVVYRITSQAAKASTHTSTHETEPSGRDPRIDEFEARVRDCQAARALLTSREISYTSHGALA
jgi:hypothetical protein